MEKANNIFDSLKEFIWDIIGYLLPGSYILIILSVCINKEYFIYPPIGNENQDFYPYIFVIISYILGHVVYGLGWFKEELLKDCSYVRKIEKEVEKRKDFVLTKQLISRALLAKGITDDLSNTTVRDLRSLAMSYIPEQDQKIYTFTFRSELSNQAANISIIIGFLGLLFSIFKCIPLHLFNTDTKCVLLYVCLILVYVFLRKTRNRFYEISIGLPFSIYLANATK